MTEVFKIKAFNRRFRMSFCGQRIGSGVIHKDVIQISNIGKSSQVVCKGSIARDVHGGCYSSACMPPPARLRPMGDRQILIVKEVDKPLRVAYP
jgi:hypothetical protein